MQSNHASPPARFIPFNKFHIAPLRDVTPGAVKEAAQLARTEYQDYEALKLTTAQNFIAQKLGFRGGFGGFHWDYESKLLPFMVEHGLERRKDLITRSDPGFDIISLKPRQVSDRLFLRDQPLPCKLFTGYDVDWFELNNRYFHHNSWRDHPGYEMGCLPYEPVMKEVARAGAESPERGRRVLDAAVAACDYSIRFGAGNLLGDQLLWFEDGGSAEPKFVPCMYKDKNCPPEAFNAHEGRMREAAKLFRAWIEQLEKGWVEVIRYNECLVFLKGRNGAYDFVFPGFRDEPFNHNPFQPHLRNGDVPKSNDTYHFRRWLYFHFNGWLEEEEHRSEITFYSRGWAASEYPKPEDVLKQHLILTGAYPPPKKPAKGVDGYYPVCVDGVLMHVGNLVSIREFREFMARNPEYAAYSRKPERVDRWEAVNCDDDESLPAAVTWHDANAYAAWVSRTRGLPVRLLTDDEYQKIAGAIVQPPGEIPREEFLDMEHERLCRFYLPDGTPIAGHPPYMREGDFQGLKFCFIPEAMTWKRVASGLAFLVSYHFGEWLNEEAAAVNSRSLSCLCHLGFPPGRGRFSATSTGKYKSKKIGFRLCYLGERADASEIAR